MTFWNILFFILRSENSTNILLISHDQTYKDHNPCVVMVNVPDCNVVVSEFEFQSRYYIHFRTNAPWEKYEFPVDYVILIFWTSLKLKVFVIVYSIVFFATSSFPKKCF